MFALVTLLTFTSAPVPPEEGILVDFSPLSQISYGSADSRAKFRFTGEAKSGKRFNDLSSYPHTLGKEGDIRDYYVQTMSDYFKVVSVGKTSMLIVGTKDEDGKVSPLSELTVKVRYFGEDLPIKWAPKVTRSGAKK